MNYLAPILSRVIAPDWKVYNDVPYGPDPRHMADMYLLNTGVRPLIILIHGGGWSAGDKSAYAGRARRYALAGFHVMAINYRLAKADDASTQWPAQFEDVKRALAWALEYAFALRIDPRRICVGGDSAGGHLALMLGTSQIKPACILNMFGPCDLRPMADLICKLPVFGGNPPTADACPIDRIDAGFPPTITIHGTKDETVGYEQAQTLTARLKTLGVRHSLITYTGGHEFGNLPDWREAWIELRGLWWLMWNLRG